MQKGHILLIDDDEEEYMIFLTALEDINAPINCSYSRSTEQALKLFKYAVPDLIFLDINMPGTNGLKCLEEIKKVKVMKKTSVFLYSNHIEDETIEKALSLGAAGCIRKPKLIGTLKKILEKVLDVDTDITVIYS